jgi:hypothetical protein
MGLMICWIFFILWYWSQLFCTLSITLSIIPLFLYPPSCCLPSHWPLTLPLLKVFSPFPLHRKLQLTNTCDHTHTWPTHLNILMVTQLTYSFNCSVPLNKYLWITVTQEVGVTMGGATKTWFHIISFYATTWQTVMCLIFLWIHLNIWNV